MCTFLLRLPLEEKAGAAPQQTALQRLTLERNNLPRTTVFLLEISPISATKPRDCQIGFPRRTGMTTLVLSALSSRRASEKQLLILTWVNSPFTKNNLAICVDGMVSWV